MAKASKERTKEQIELDVRIINSVIDELKRINRIKSPYEFSKELGYLSTMSIYSIQKGLKPLSNSIKNKIREVFPEVDHEFLKSGTGDVLKKPEAHNFNPNTAEENETSALVLKQLIQNNLKIDAQNKKLDSQNEKLDEILAILKNKV